MILLLFFFRQLFGYCCLFLYEKYRQITDVSLGLQLELFLICVRLSCTASVIQINKAIRAAASPFVTPLQTSCYSDMDSSFVLP